MVTALFHVDDHGYHLYDPSKKTLSLKELDKNCLKWILQSKHEWMSGDLACSLSLHLTILTCSTPQTRLSYQEIETPNTDLVVRQDEYPDI